MAFTKAGTHTVSSASFYLGAGAVFGFSAFDLWGGGADGSPAFALVAAFWRTPPLDTLNHPIRLFRGFANFWAALASLWAALFWPAFSACDLGQQSYFLDGYFRAERRRTQLFRRQI